MASGRDVVVVAASAGRGLWLAVRSLDERGRLTVGLADAARERGHSRSAGQFSEAAAAARRSADALREVAGSMTAQKPEAEQS